MSKKSRNSRNNVEVIDKKSFIKDYNSKNYEMDVLNEKYSRPTISNKKVNIKCKNIHQKEFIKMIDSHEITLCSGPAGCGKSYLSLMKAIEYLQIPNNGYDKIYIITPLVEIGEKIGSLPGTLEDKLSPFMYSTYYLIDKVLGKETRLKMVEDGRIEALALSFLRGVNIDNAILIFEEAQNSTIDQMKTLLTRIGENTKFIISGDLEQIDRFKRKEDSGMKKAMESLDDIDNIGLFAFEHDDIVRNPLIGKILDRF